jgi:aryl-alcohol dehydrogenase-like predicted oxidoreductase
MQYRRLGSTGWEVSAIGFGAWALGADWGAVTDDDAMAALHAAVDSGVNFIDTADVYGDGRSEQLVSRLLRERPDDEIHVATKAGRRLDPHNAAGYTGQNITRFVDRSLTNLSIDSVPLLQLHCPPSDVYYRPEVFAALDDLKAAGKIRHYGVSVEKVEEALKATGFPGVESIQIIFNAFRHRPSELFFREAATRDVGIIARVPLASGLLSGRMDRQSSFPPDDHRSYNRDGAAFDVGETFAGVPYEAGLDAVDAIRRLVPEGWTMAQLALRWILMWDEVSTTIPGAKNPQQATDNAAAADLPPIEAATMAHLESLYRDRIGPLVHHRW